MIKQQIPKEKAPKGIGFIIGASSVGTLIEWYDFYIFGMLATIIAKQFFPENSGTSALLSTLAIFAAGFIVRPFGALVFGRLGDIIGRKHTFLLTLVLMGGSTFLIGLVPGYATIGWAAPLLVLLLRLVQGLALGGEYGGAATYVAEHAPAHRRGFYTSWIQTTATLGLFLALGIIILIRQWQGVEAFSAEWGGWRFPFWISLGLVLISIIIRLQMSESPLFSQLKASGKTSKNPLKESFGHKANFKMVLLALFGAVMGQGVVWYTGQFYAQSFLETVCQIEFLQSRNIILLAIALATPGFVLFGWLSDKIGRKWIMMTGMFLAAICYRPIYSYMLDETDTTALLKAKSYTIGKPNANSFRTEYEQGKTISYYDATITFNNGITAKATVADSLHASSPSDYESPDQEIQQGVTVMRVQEKVLPPSGFRLMMLLVFIQVVFVTMVYGPIAAFLVELFPTKIRYTSMSLPYHIGNGVFGGLVPFLATLIVQFTKTTENPGGNPLAGLWYPIGVAAVCFVIGAVYLRNTIDRNVMD